MGITITVPSNAMMRHAIPLLLLAILLSSCDAHLHRRLASRSERVAHAYDELAADLEASDIQLKHNLDTVQILNKNVKELSSLLFAARTDLAAERSTTQELREKIASMAKQPEVDTSRLPAAPLSRGMRGA